MTKKIDILKTVLAALIARSRDLRQRDILHRATAQLRKRPCAEAYKSTHHCNSSRRRQACPLITMWRCANPPNRRLTSSTQPLALQGVSRRQGFSSRAAARAAERLIVLPPLRPSAEHAHAVPMPECLRKRPPGDVVNHKIVQGFEKFSVIVALVAGRDRDASNSRTSASVMVVSMVGSPKTDCP
jgi:hypothetical protein